MKILKNREHWQNVTYSRSFLNPKVLGAGWGFDCDADGKVFELSNDLAKENLRKCLAGEGGIIDDGIKTYRSSGISPAVGLCDDCGAEVYLSHFTNTCDCGADYNMSGERLASREQWGEETGEHWSDCY